MKQRNLPRNIYRYSNRCRIGMLLSNKEGSHDAGVYCPSLINSRLTVKEQVTQAFNLEMDG